MMICRIFDLHTTVTLRCSGCAVFYVIAIVRSCSCYYCCLTTTDENFGPTTSTNKATNISKLQEVSEHERAREDDTPPPSTVE